MKPGRWNAQPTVENQWYWRGLIFCSPLWEHGGSNVVDVGPLHERGAFVNSPSWERDGLDFTGSAEDAVQFTGLLGEPTEITLMVVLEHDSIDSAGSHYFTLGDSVMIRQTTTELRGSYRYASGWRDTSVVRTIHGDGLRHVFFYVVRNGFQGLFLDADNIAATTFTDAINYDQGADTWLGRHGNGATTLDFDGRIFIAAAWDRDVKSAVRRRLTVDPYSLIRPPRHFLPMFPFADRPLPRIIVRSP